MAAADLFADFVADHAAHDRTTDRAARVAADRMPRRTAEDRAGSRSAAGQTRGSNYNGQHQRSEGFHGQDSFERLRSPVQSKIKATRAKSVTPERRRVVALRR